MFLDNFQEMLPTSYAFNVAKYNIYYNLGEIFSGERSNYSQKQ